jgi:cell division protein FtsB
MISLVLLICVGYFVWLTWFGSRGNRALNKVEAEIEQIKNHNLELTVENQRYSLKISRLQSDSRYQELVVRRELHLIRDNEILFLFDEH